MTPDTAPQVSTPAGRHGWHNASHKPMNSNPFNILLDTPYGVKTLFSNRSGMVEFFSMPPGPDFFAVSFPSKEEAQSYLDKSHAPLSESIHIGGPV